MAKVGYMPNRDYFNTKQVETAGTVTTPAVCSNEAPVTCLDYTGWEDGDGDVCGQYRIQETAESIAGEYDPPIMYCPAGGLNINPAGETANDACCSCGGGRALALDHMSFFIAPSESGAVFRSIAGKHFLTVVQVQICCTDIDLTVMIYPAGIVLTFAKCHSEIVLLVLLFRTEIVLTVLKFLTEICPHSSRSYCFEISH